MVTGSNCDCACSMSTKTPRHILLLSWKIAGKLCWRSDLSTAPVFVVPLALAVVLAGELRQHPGGVQGPGVALSPGAHDEPLAGG